MDTKKVAQGLLDNEFENFANDPKAYCKAMGWDVNSEATKTAIKHKDDLTFTVEDVQNLKSILDSMSPDTDVLDVMDSNAVSDFLPNCVASHIIGKFWKC